MSGPDADRGEAGEPSMMAGGDDAGGTHLSNESEPEMGWMPSVTPGLVGFAALTWMKPA
jgi:hypothetical protein